MNSEIKLLESQIENMKNILDIEKLVETHDDISKKLLHMRKKITDAEIYIDSINNFSDEENTDVIFCDSDTADDLDDLDDKNNQYSNNKFLQDIEELKNIESHIGNHDIDLEELMDLYEKSQIISQDIAEYLGNQKLYISNID